MKKTYDTPLLTVHGDVRALTEVSMHAASTTTGTESESGSEDGDS